VSECDCETSILRRPGPARGCYVIKNMVEFILEIVLSYSGTQIEV
jgi:hypothetical protein